MDLLKYLEPMKNIPERFSNLAFWRGVRKLRDEVVNAFEYVDSWGDNIENKEAQMKSDIANAQTIANDAQTIANDAQTIANAANYTTKYSISNEPWQSTQPKTTIVKNNIGVRVNSSDKSIVIIVNNNSPLSFTQKLGLPNVPDNKELIVFGAFFSVSVEFSSGNQSFLVPASVNLSVDRATNTASVVILPNATGIYLTDTPVSADCVFLCDVGFNFTV